MNEEPTQEQPMDARPFEERIFARFDMLDARFDNVESRLSNLETKSYDTKPIWERVLAEITELRTETRAAITELRTEMHASFRKMERKIDILNQTMLDVRADLRDHEDRLAKLENQR